MIGHAFRLAVSHLAHRWGQTAALALAVALLALAPVATRIVLHTAEQSLTARAEATPLVIGARGAALDLIMNGLHFTEARPPTTTMQVAEAVWDSGLAEAYPLHVRHRANGAPLVGVTLDYLAFRGLEVAEGRGLALLGEALAGARAAEALGLRPGGHVLSEPESLFDLGGVYPLRMPVVGVLAETGGPDDHAIFVDLRTAWVIAGIGHGHAPQAGEGGPAADGFAEITPDTIDSFHFHGDPAGFPISLVLVAPHDARAAAILKGRHLDPQSPVQMVSPAEAVSALLDEVFRVGRVLDAATAATAAGALLAIGLAMRLALLMRREEFATLARMGGPRGLTMAMVGAEIFIILSSSLCILLLLLLPVTHLAELVALRLVTD